MLNGTEAAAEIYAQVARPGKEAHQYPPEGKKVVEEFNTSTNEWHLHAEPSARVDLEKWAELAGFDDWEMRVLRYRLSEASRDEAA